MSIRSLPKKPATSASVVQHAKVEDERARPLRDGAEVQRIDGAVVGEGADIGRVVEYRVGKAARGVRHLYRPCVAVQPGSYLFARSANSTINVPCHNSNDAEGRAACHICKAIAMCQPASRFATKLASGGSRTPMAGDASRGADGMALAGYFHGRHEGTKIYELRAFVPFW
ncbi:MAG TPA: hypothetical protein VK741_10030 [Acetobacteraceae bacterium]|nr:hypothetical protein [Acetobacteraceae bacterium]